MTDVVTVNVATHLEAMSRSCPYQTAVACPEAKNQRGQTAYTVLNFKQLHEQSDHLAHFLHGIGLRRGMRTVLMVPPSLDFFKLTFALFKLGAVPILIDPGMGILNLGRCLREAEPEAFVGVTKANLARKLLGWGRSTVRITVTTGRLFAEFVIPTPPDESGRPTEPFPQAPTAADEIAAILFTSGSTGPAKGVIYTHGIFAAQIEMLRNTYNIGRGEIDLCTFPLFALFAPALGMTAIIPDMDPTRPADADPLKIVQAIQTFGVTNLFGSPALLNRVGRFVAPRAIRLPTLKRVISAGAPVPAHVIDRFTTALVGGAQVHTPYGATEALPVASIGSDVLLESTRHATNKGCGVCVGSPVEPMQVRIVPISDAPILNWDETTCLCDGQIGEIVVSGPVVTTSYFNRPEETNLAKITDPNTGTVWHRMGDLGYLDRSGRLWFCGRKSHRVVTAQGTLFTIPCEAVFNGIDNIYRTALVGVKSAGRTFPVLCVEFEPAESVSAEKNVEWLREIALGHPHTRTIAAFLVHPAFPVDVRHNAKIFREKLAVWAAKQVAGRSWPISDEPVVLPPTVDELDQVLEDVRA